MSWRSILKEDKDTFAFDEDGKPMSLEEWSNKEAENDLIYIQNLKAQFKIRLLKLETIAV